MASSGIVTTLQLHRARRAALMLALIFPGVMALAGCSRGPAMAQVGGKVLYEDGSAPRGGVCVVRFEPTGESTAEIRKGASGNIGPDGSFELWTRMPGDGVYHGEYAVTFAVWKGPMEPTSLILEKYTSAADTPYKVTVDGDLDDLDFEIEALPGAPRAAAGAGSAAR